MPTTASATKSIRIHRNSQVAEALATARLTIAMLNDENIAVLGVLATDGRRPTLIVERLPHGVVSVIKRRHPNGMGGITTVRATQWNGCQLEAMRDEPAGTARVSACGRAAEEVARG